MNLEWNPKYDWSGMCVLMNLFYEWKSEKESSLRFPQTEKKERFWNVHTKNMPKAIKNWHESHVQTYMKSVSEIELWMKIIIKELNLIKCI